MVEISLGTYHVLAWRFPLIKTLATRSRQRREILGAKFLHTFFIS
jgi:hypothetical protein